MRYYKEKTIKTEAELKKEREEKQGISSENGAKAEATDAKSEDKSEPQLVWIRKFKGSIFVVFKTVELAKKLLDETSIDFKGATIVSCKSYMISNVFEGMTCM